MKHLESIWQGDHIYLLNLVSSLIFYCSFNSRSFIVTYDCFSDNFIHKSRQRYNKPQNLTTRINLSELSLEIKLRPPYELTISDIEPVRNGSLYKHIANIPQLGGLYFIIKTKFKYVFLIFN